MTPRRPTVGAQVAGLALGTLAPWGCSTAAPAEVGQRVESRETPSHDAAFVEVGEPRAMGDAGPAGMPTDAAAPAPTTTPQNVDVPVALTASELQLTCEEPLVPVYEAAPWIGRRCYRWSALARLGIDPSPATDAGGGSRLDACPPSAHVASDSVSAGGCLDVILCPNAASADADGCCYEVIQYCGF